MHLPQEGVPDPAIEPVPEVESRKDRFSDPNLYVNRELSLLSFQRRVLEEARDGGHPLLERVKLLSIVHSNLDEFFMVRVAGRKQQAAAGIVETGPDGLSMTALFQAIRREVLAILRESRECLDRDLLPSLARAGLELVRYADLSPAEKEIADKYFVEAVLPVLTPLAFDPGRPFPRISNLSLNLAVRLRDTSGVERFARVKVADTLPQLIQVPPAPAVVPAPARKRPRDAKGPAVQRLIWLEDLIAANIGALFPGIEILDVHPFHVTRDADPAIQEWEAVDLLDTVQQAIRQRRFGTVVRLIVSESMPEETLELLAEKLHAAPEDIYPVAGPLGMARLRALHGLNRPDLKDPAFLPAVPAALQSAEDEEDMFAVMRHGPALLHHPFHSFQPVVDWLRQAAEDPDVLAIKITLYRVGRSSPLLDALVEAARQGKQVTAVVEVRARFDEESNIAWARQLEKSGAHVVHGLVGLKVHCKAALVVRREGNLLRRYTHLSTGNYNVVTTRLYTDLGLLTTDEQIGADVTDLFNFLTGYSAKSDYRRLLVAPVNLRKRLESMIGREIEHQRSGRQGHIIFKVNALVDTQLIRRLFEASQAGVKVDLLVRGMCALRPGVPGVSDNITVTSVVGRFLEHDRIYYFRNGGDHEVYAGSSDLMPRNLDRRVEVLFPILDPALVRQCVEEILPTYFADNVRAWRMRPDATYERPKPRPDEARVDAQAEFLRRAAQSVVTP